MGSNVLNRCIPVKNQNDPLVLPTSEAEAESVHDCTWRLSSALAFVSRGSLLRNSSRVGDATSEGAEDSLRLRGYSVVNSVSSVETVLQYHCTLW